MASEKVSFPSYTGTLLCGQGRPSYPFYTYFHHLHLFYVSFPSLSFFFPPKYRPSWSDWWPNTTSSIEGGWSGIGRVLSHFLTCSSEASSILFLFESRVIFHQTTWTHIHGVKKRVSRYCNWFQGSFIYTWKLLCSCGKSLATCHLTPTNHPSSFLGSFIHPLFSSYLEVETYGRVDLATYQLFLLSSFLLHLLLSFFPLILGKFCTLQASLYLSLSLSHSLVTCRPSNESQNECLFYP